MKPFTDLYHCDYRHKLGCQGPVLPSWDGSAFPDLSHLICRPVGCLASCAGRHTLILHPHAVLLAGEACSKLSAVARRVSGISHMQPWESK